MIVGKIRNILFATNKICSVAAKSCFIVSYALWIFAGFFPAQSLAENSKTFSASISGNTQKSKVKLAGYNLLTAQFSNQSSDIIDQETAEENEDNDHDYNFLTDCSRFSLFVSIEKPTSLNSSTDRKGNNVSLYVLYHCWKSFLA